jgi:hypothetical protein
MSFLRDVFSDSPAASFGRFASFICLAFCMGWDTAAVWFLFSHWSVLHPQIGDIWVPAATLMGQGTFCLLFYGTNKLKASLDGPPSPDNGKQ